MCDVPQPSSRRAFGSRDRATASAQLVAVRRGRLIAAAIGAALLAVWAAGATWCLLASDTLSAGLLARQSAIQYGYEDRIGDLRTRLDRVSTQKLVEQESLNARLHELAGRQLKIQARQGGREPARGAGRRDRRRRRIGGRRRSQCRRRSRAGDDARAAPGKAAPGAGSARPAPRRRA